MLTILVLLWQFCISTLNFYRWDLLLLPDSSFLTQLPIGRRDALCGKVCPNHIKQVRPAAYFCEHMNEHAPSWGPEFCMLTSKILSFHTYDHDSTCLRVTRHPVSVCVCVCVSVRAQSCSTLCSFCCAFQFWRLSSLNNFLWFHLFTFLFRLPLLEDPFYKNSCCSCGLGDALI